MRGEWQIALQKMRSEQRTAGWNLIVPEVVAKLADEDLQGYLTKPISIVPLMEQEKEKGKRPKCQIVLGGEVVDEERGHGPMSTSSRDRGSANL